MFRSSRWSSTENDANTSSNSNNAEGISPLDELSSLLDELELAVDNPMKAYVESLIPASYQEKIMSLTIKKSTTSSVLDSLKKFRNRKKGNEDSTEASGHSTPTSGAASESADSVASTVNPLSSTKSGTSGLTTPTSLSTTIPSTDPVTATTSPPKSQSFKFPSKDPNARFLPTISMEDQDRFVEVIRRISELVVYGERAAATMLSEKSKLDKLTEESNKEEYDRAMSRIAESEPYASVFEFFFERNTLSFVTDILAGKAFDVRIHIDKLKCALLRERKVNEDLVESVTTSSSADGGDDTNNSKSAAVAASKEVIEVINVKLKGLDAIDFDAPEVKHVLLLPPLAVATQGFQSVSILVQNVKRATSLFFLLSNNHVNMLIDFPLDEYHIAERKKYQEANDPNVNTFISPRRFGSPELAELTTTFVTFLKSLALRMNAETLQFFLTYPTDTAIEGDTDYLADQIDDDDVKAQDDEDGERPMDEVASNSTAKDLKKEVNRPIAVKHIEVDFPLYERALEFCSAHHDSFVRTTAMNICLNTLRLTTVSPKDGEDEPEADLVAAESSSSPDAALHNAKALPMRERLAIAQYVCAPSRVEKLASPIFTKLAQLWGVLEEQFRELDDTAKSIQDRTAKTSDNGSDDDDPTRSKKKAVNEKVARAREKARRTKFSGIFNDASYNLQDELLLLEDLLRVGLTSFNEQTIEMMFATFVYPLLLQPLILYYQRSGVSVDVLFDDVINNHYSGEKLNPQDIANIDTVKALIAAPAKSALFCLAAVFQFVTNPPLLRLLFTAVFHPLSPNASGEILIRAKADVACIGEDGKATIRLDSVDEDGKMRCKSDRSTYIFGTVTGRKEVSGRKDNKGNSDTCVFVLSPALVEILEFDGMDGRIVAKTRHNPYRKAIFQCFTLSPEVSDLQPLSVIAVDSAVSVFEKEFLADILFGLDIKRYRDSLPADVLAGSFQDDLDLDDDRGIGSGPASSKVESRLSLEAPAGGKIHFDYMNEVVFSFKSCMIKATSGGKGTWRLEYDMVAAHALLSSIRGSQKAITCAYHAIDHRRRQTASFLSEIPKTIDKLAHNKLLSDTAISKLPTKDEGNYDAIMNMIVMKGSPIFEDIKPAVENTVKLKKEHQADDKDSTLHVPVSALGSYKELGSRACSFSRLQPEAAENSFRVGVESVEAWFKIDALAGMLKTLVHSDKIVNDVVSTFDPNTVYAAISDSFYATLYNVDGPNDIARASSKPGAVISLVGKIAFPCVCEVSPSCAPLFSDMGAKIVAQGITWQSLYLVLLGDYFLLAEPDKGSPGQGRVVTSCRLENLTADRDPENARMDTSARRLMLVHNSPESTCPGMFRFTADPKPTETGPFIKMTDWSSHLDIWFEDNRAIQLAFNKIQEKISEARAHRGRFIRQHLSQGENSSSPRDES